jgi:hypothetical protein
MVHILTQEFPIFLWYPIIHYLSPDFPSVTVILSKKCQWRMASSGMLRHVALVRTDVSEKLSASFIKVTRIGELGSTLALTSNRITLRRILPSSPILVTLMKVALRYSVTSVFRRATRRNIPDNAIIQFSFSFKTYYAGECFLFWAPSLTRGPVCNLHLLLVIQCIPSPIRVTRDSSQAWGSLVWRG